MTAQVAADLRAAAEVLRRDGWTRLVLTDPASGAHCAAGAVVEAVPRQVRRAALFDFIGPRLGSGLMHWNDNVAKDADEVIATLEAAADAAEADL